MAKTWSKKEFETLLENPRMSSEELHRHIPTRTTGAIDTVRSFIHSYHIGGNVSGLSKMMVERLKRGNWACSKCRSK
jgi:hypothetical protein